MKNYIKFILLFAFIALISFNINAVNLKDSNYFSNYNINIDVTSETSAKITEEWYLSNELSAKEINSFKEKLFNANLDIEKFKKIDSLLSPHVYINDHSRLSVQFNDNKKSVSLSYTINELTLIEYFESNKEILWRFNQNLLKFFIKNDLYSIKEGSTLTIDFYEPLIIQKPNPSGDILDNSITYSGISTNDFRLLVLEKKPPKPSLIFNLSNDFLNNTIYFYIFVLLILIFLLVFYNKKIKSKIKKYIEKNSEIKIEKKQDIFNEFE